ncbi:response regulator transcription factor [Chitinophaga sp. 212800010-3]|uniref:response regulator transcription factor n=2 Tax=Chitinophaga TaxID=79328 RepID=UPI002DEB6728|nr:DNA-binding response regulator [Chitinophaga sp. 212800010-3]
MNQNKIRLGIIEDNQMLVKLLLYYFESSEQVEVVFHSNSTIDLIDLCRQQRPQVILMDFYLEGGDDIKALRQVQAYNPDIKVLMFTILDDDHHVFDAIKGGASGYLLKSTSLPQVEVAVLDVLKGGAVVTPHIASKVFKVLRESSKEVKELQVLTPRENQIMQALVKGLTYKEVANELDIRVGTVRTHIENIYEKLQVKSKAEAVAKYLKR